MSYLRKINEAIRAIDELSTGKELRSAQRRALQKLRRQLIRLRDKLAGDGSPGTSLSREALRLLGKFLEIWAAYF